MAKKNNSVAVSCMKEDDLIIITGAGGFITGALARYFRKQGFTRIPKTCPRRFPY
jgi:NADP-dependent 3-hydroxy acid dehydrogenase YdfG